MATDSNQPFLTFHGRLKASNIIDLANDATIHALGLTGEDLTGSFRTKVLNIQHLGHAVSMQSDAVAIRYPSRAMSALGQIGYNLAIFPDAISSPDAFEIFGPNNTIIESW